MYLLDILTSEYILKIYVPDNVSPDTDNKNQILSASEPLKQLLVSLDALRSYLQIPASNTKCVAILQEIPCLLRCITDIQLAGKFNGHIDPVFKIKHDYAKTKIVDAILRNIGNHVVIKSEFNLGTGSLTWPYYRSEHFLINHLG